MNDFDVTDIKKIWTFHKINRKMRTSSTYSFMRKFRKIFWCNHKYIQCSKDYHVYGILSDGTSFELKGYFCNKCWDLLDENRYKQIMRNEGLDKIGL